MKKFFYTLAIASLIAPAVSARTLSESEAKANAVAFLSKGMQKAPGFKADAMRMAGVMNDKNGAPALYIFTGTEGSNGLVVTSASSETVPVLGYSDSGEFDFDKMPPSMKALLEDYASEIAMAEAGQTKMVFAAPTPERAAIAPICKTQWNQNAPYNNLTPVLTGQHCMTGCVATAMAQVMKVFECPAEHGEGYISYEWKAGGQTLDIDLASTTLNWADMLDDYHGDATDAQKEAVATLMRDCGYATHMQYTLSASGTTADYIPSTLYYNFGYDSNVHTLQRAYYSLSDWETIIYDQLTKGSPVIFTGVSSAEGGHCFVCDGYSSDRYYHINWGWGGMSDGYFLLSALNPSVQGIGGSTGGFNNMVNACVGIQKPVEGSQMYTEILCDGNFTTSSQSYAVPQNVTFTSDAFYNPTMAKENLYMGVKLTDGEGNVTYLRSNNQYSLATYQMVRQYNVSGANFPESGTYTVTAAWYNIDADRWEDVGTRIDAQSALNLTIEDGMLSFIPISKDYQVAIENVNILTDMYTNTNFKVSAEIVNSGDVEFLGEVMAAVLTAGDEVAATSEPFNVDIEGGDTQSLDMVTRFTKAPEEGTYYFCFVTSDGKILSEPFEVTLSAITGNTAIALMDLHMLTGDGTNTPVVPQNNVAVGGAIRCTNGYYNNTLTAYIFPQRGGTALGTIGAETFFIHSGDEQNFEMYGSFGNGVVGTTYMIGFFNNNAQVPGVVFFVLGDEDTGIEYVTTPESVKLTVDGNMLIVSGAESAQIDVYSASGANVLSVNSLSADVSTLVPGAYIAVAQTSEGPVMVKFIR